MREAGLPGMSDEEVPRCSVITGVFVFFSPQIWANENFSNCVNHLQVMDFVSRYLPAYNAYLPTLYSEGPNGSDPERLLVIEIDEGRNPF